ncbi:hypothetical protein PVMG_05353 [Plasmodium vivax Mauritania I]|uniref:Uncharacterized protein n=1 Tax=Plasmodium vivax Mauritania I TaxID=1035515 RepID=A0A0J9TKG1_PLAVI|nr:hypothetical protein PVMG_05353 [Plasmodium vivax Mauritania I]
MSQNSLNIKQMKNDYPFLKELWDLYDGFDKPVEGDNKRIYEGYCNLVKDRLNYDKAKYYDICMMLIRNLDPSSKVVEKSISPSHRCFNVNNWLYDTMKKKHLNNKDIIDWIFVLSKSVNSENIKNGCSYYSYDTQYKDPINIIHLKMFDDNIDVIKSTLAKESEPNNSSVQKYLCKFVQIYKQMYSSYCSDTHRKTHKEIKICGELGTLRISYNIFRSGQPGISGKIPSLDAKEQDPLDICSPYIQETELSSQEGDISGSSTSSKIPATIGTMAGVSSVFALLYKVNTKFYLNI